MSIGTEPEDGVADRGVRSVQAAVGGVLGDAGPGVHSGSSAAVAGEVEVKGEVVEVEVEVKGAANEG